MGFGGGGAERSVPVPVPSRRSKTNALNISQKMIEMFVRTKHKIDKSHEFALVVVNNDATWVSGTGTGTGWGRGQVGDRMRMGMGAGWDEYGDEDGMG